jgi:hypothetical protein
MDNPTTNASAPRDFEMVSRAHVRQLLIGLLYAADGHEHEGVDMQSIYTISLEDLQQMVATAINKKAELASSTRHIVYVPQPQTWIDPPLPWAVTLTAKSEGT